MTEASQGLPFWTNTSILPSLCSQNVYTWTCTNDPRHTHTLTHHHGDSLLLPSALLSTELHQGTLTCLHSYKQMSSALTPLSGQICPNSHLICTGNGFIHYGWHTLCCAPQRIRKAICRDTFLKQRSSLQEKVKMTLSFNLNISLCLHLADLRDKLRVCGHSPLGSSASAMPSRLLGRKTR